MVLLVPSNPYSVHKHGQSQGKRRSDRKASCRHPPTTCRQPLGNLLHRHTVADPPPPCTSCAYH